MTSTPLIGAWPRYDPRRSYQWNYEHAPQPFDVEVPPVPGDWRFCGLAVDSPLGMPAGPLLNGRWCVYYASLGFDVLTYKTVRSRARASYPLPNLQPVAAAQLDGSGAPLAATATMAGSWAVSFGMPSQEPDVWRQDVQWTRRQLPAGKLLCVSVVGSAEPGWTIDDLAADYARCARWAIDSGADCVEANFSCPNVLSRDGQLYQQPEAAAAVAAALREAAGQTPVVVKIGHLGSRFEAARLVESLAPYVDALATVNCLAVPVVGEDGTPMFDGQPRGIAGRAIRAASLAQVSLLAGLIARRSLALGLVGVGGAATAADVAQYLAAGAEAVQIATAAMLDPGVGLAIRRALAACLSQAAK